MRNPENVLNGLQKHSTQKGYSYIRLYRNMFNRNLFLQAYQNIYSKQGNMTAGTDNKTIDAMSVQRIDRIIDTLKNESYTPHPAKRIYIPKKNGKLRPLGIPTIDDKLVQEVIRMILESIYENSFENISHGFRPNKSCHTALKQIKNKFTRCKWYVEGDIKSFFDNIDHNILINILRKKIKDERFINLIRKFLKAGYMEQNQLYKTYSGTPQGGIISPILANIYLDQFDKYMVEYKKQFDKGTERARNKEYQKLKDKKNNTAKKLNNCSDPEIRSNLIKEIKRLNELYTTLPCKEPMDANYRRIQYVRYCDDFIIGIIGSKKDAEKVKEDIGNFISEKLHLELSMEKTLITKSTKRARFLGYDIRTTPNTNQTKRNKNGFKARNYKGHVMLEIPTGIIKKKLIEMSAMKIILHNNTEIWKPTRRGNLIGRTDLDILDQYNCEIRGFCNYYAMANNSYKLHKFRYIMEYSFYKTMACKYRTRKSKIIKKFRINKDIGIKFKDKHGNEKVRLLWKDSLVRKTEPLFDSVDRIYENKIKNKKPSLIKRLNSNKCEWCGKITNEIEVHQVRNLKELKSNEKWAIFMKSINRKTLIVCKDCHKTFKE